MGRPGSRFQRLLANEIGEDGARLLAGVGADMDPLEEVAVGRVGVDLALRGRPGDRQGRQDLWRTVREAHDLRHLPETGEILRLEVEHRDSMAVHAAFDVDDQLATAGLGLHGRDPLGCLALVQLHAEPSRRLDDPGDRLVSGRRRRHAMPSFPCSDPVWGPWTIMATPGRE